MAKIIAVFQLLLMAKKNIKRKENQEEPITKCDKSEGVVANCDRKTV